MSKPTSHNDLAVSPGQSQVEGTDEPPQNAGPEIDWYAFDGQAIPASMKALSQWVCWEAYPGPKKIEKRPVNAHTGYYASTTDPTTWADYQTTCAYAMQRNLGVGFVFRPENDVLGVDLDHCRDAKTETIEPWARTIIDRWNSYTEISPSGTGVHLYAVGQLPPGGRKKGNIEIYEEERFFTVTGNHLEGTPITIEDRQAELNHIYSQYFPEKKPAKPHVHGNSQRSCSIEDDVLIEKAKSARNGTDFTLLWEGDWSKYRDQDESQSEADLALANHLCFWTNGDMAKMDRLFRSSGLYRAKWDEPRGQHTYGEMTMTKAVTSVTEYYQGPRLNNGSPIQNDTPSEVPSFPIEVLPLPLQRFVNEAAQSFPCPPDFLAVPLLVMLGAAIGRSRVLEVKPGWQEGARLWAAIVGDPGDIKTPVLALASKWAKDRQASDWEDFQNKDKQHQRALLEFEVKLKRWKDSKLKNKLPIKEEGDGPPAQPTPPTYRRTVVSDVTLEALALILTENPRGVALVSDELTAWFKGIGQYKKNGGADRKHWLSIWSHQGLTVDRLTRGSVYVPAPFVSVTGSIQPGSLKDLDPEEGMKDGFIHRLLFVEPEPVQISYTDHVISTESFEAIGKVFDALYGLEGTQEENKNDSIRHIPQSLAFTDEAKTEWITWYNDHCLEPYHQDFPAILKGPWAKLRGYSVTLALILALSDNSKATVVSKEPALGAISLIEEYFKPHLKRLYPKMLSRKRTPFDLCRAAIMRVLDQRNLTHKEIRQGIRGRFKGDLVREVLEDLRDSGTIATRPKPEAKEGVIEYYQCENETV